MTGFSLSPNWTTLKLHCPWFFYISSRLLCTYVSIVVEPDMKFSTLWYKFGMILFQDWTCSIKITKKGGEFWFLKYRFYFIKSLNYWEINCNFLKHVIYIDTVTETADFGFILLLWLPQGPQGCLEKQNCPLSLNLVVWCAKIGFKS